MASQVQVKQYLASWLQLGKGLALQGGQVLARPSTVIAGDRYSQEFESYWQQVCAADTGDCYLEGTDVTVAQLLSSQWDIIDCSRCSMPTPIPNAGIAGPDCPCHDLSNWPNDELPHPRQPVSNGTHLQNIRQRLSELN